MCCCSEGSMRLRTSSQQQQICFVCLTPSSQGNFVHSAHFLRLKTSCFPWYVTTMVQCGCTETFFRRQEWTRRIWSPTRKLVVCGQHLFLVTCGHTVYRVCVSIELKYVKHASKIALNRRRRGRAGEFGVGRNSGVKGSNIGQNKAATKSETLNVDAHGQSHNCSF